MNLFLFQCNDLDNDSFVIIVMILIMVKLWAETVRHIRVCLTEFNVFLEMSD